MNEKLTLYTRVNYSTIGKFTTNPLSFKTFKRLYNTFPVIIPEDGYYTNIEGELIQVCKDDILLYFEVPWSYQRDYDIKSTYHLAKISDIKKVLEIVGYRGNDQEPSTEPECIGKNND